MSQTNIPTLEKQYQRTLDNLPTGATEVWLFESRAAREAATAAYKAKGRDIVIRSAYKTLLCEIIEQDLLAEVQSVRIRYPVVAGDEPLRFRLEAYPIAALYPDCHISFEPIPYTAVLKDLPCYTLARLFQTSSSKQNDEIRIPVPVRWEHHAAGGEVLAATGWVHFDDSSEFPIQTDYQAIYQDIVSYLLELPLNPKSAAEPNGPFFDRLAIQLSGPFADEPIAVGGETLSLAEAMHEEIYFSALELFEQRLVANQNITTEEVHHKKDLSRHIRPGQIVPMIRVAGQYTLSISEISNADILGIGEELTHSSCDCLDDADHWLSPADIQGQLNDLGGERFCVTSRQGRASEGRYITATAGGSGAQLAISGAQHANESSGVVGALRAAQALKESGKVSFTVCPVENPDGYALYHELCCDNPQHMHHAARYSAGGNDISCGEGLYESAIRDAAKQRLPAKVHLNLHGYPAHEWTRPLTGYVPRGFARWTIPKGFFLICRYKTDADRMLALEVLQVALRALEKFPQLMQRNIEQLSRYLYTIGSSDFEVYRDAIPYSVDKSDDEAYPVTLITEAPDESVYGKDFQLAHEAHYQVIMAVADYLATRKSDIRHCASGHINRL